MAAAVKVPVQWSTLGSVAAAVSSGINAGHAVVGAVGLAGESSVFQFNAAVNAELVAAERNAIQLTGRLGAIAGQLFDAGFVGALNNAGAIAAQLAVVQRNAAQLAGQLSFAAAQFAASGANSGAIFSYLASTERQVAQIFSQINTIGAVLSANSNGQAGLILGELTAAQNVALQLAQQISAIIAYQFAGNGNWAAEFEAVGFQVEIAERQAARLAAVVGYAARQLSGSAAVEVAAAAEQNAALLANRLAAIAVQLGGYGAGLASDFGSFSGQLAIAERQAAQLSSQIGTLGAGIATWYLASGIAAQLADAQYIAAQLTRHIASINVRLNYNYNNVAAFIDGFKNLERAYSNDLSLLSSRPASYLENYSLTYPIRIDALGNRWLNYHFNLKGYKPEEINVTLNAKDRVISVEASHDIKDKTYEIRRQYSRKAHIADDIKVDLSKLELKSYLTNEGLLVIEAALPKVSAEEARSGAWAKYSAPNAGNVYEVASKIN